MPRLTYVAAAAAAVSLTSLSPAPAGAAFDTVPFGCDARATPWHGLSVFSTQNPNADTVFVDYGSDNIVLESPNFRPGQPTAFPSGFVEGVFGAGTDTYSEIDGTVSWYLLGGLARTGDAACEGIDAPRNLEPPRVVGDPVAGGTVTLHPGAWAGGGPSLRRFAWVESCDDEGCLPLRISGTLGVSGDELDLTGPRTYPIDAEQVGKRLRLMVAAYSWRGVTTASSALTPAVSGTAVPGAPGVRPEAHRPVAIGGTLTVPMDLVDWPGAQPTLAYRWERCAGGCEDIPGATAVVHRLTPDDLGRTLRVTVTATNADGSATRTSAGIVVTQVMIDADSQALAAVGPRVADVAQVGRALTGDEGVWIDDGSEHQYAWQRCTDECTDIPGAHLPSYTPTPADVGARLRLLVSATSGARTWSGRPATSTVTTPLSDPVLPADPPPPDPQDRVPPRLTGVSLRPAQVAAKGTTLRVTISERATLVLQVRKANRPAKVVAQVRRSLAAGAHQLRLGRRIGGVTLAPRRYTLTLVATDAAGNRSTAKTLSFRVMR